MGRAAIPNYLPAADFEQASPALRFGMYLPVWGVDHATGELRWETSDRTSAARGEERAVRQITPENKRSALQKACKLSAADRALAEALLARQRAVAGTSVGALLRIEARASSPFTTGLGNEHPLENGYAFLSPYGLPYLPGSGVKGVLRRAAQELVLLQHGGWDAAGSFVLAQRDDLPVVLDAIDVLFGREPPDGDGDHVRGVLTFWDVLPQLPGDSLLVEVMTPHQSHYIQQGEPPHDSGKPNPITFLTVPPGAGFAFHVVCDLPRLRRLAPALAAGESWTRLLSFAFAHAFDWLGFGAKTAVGYGAMVRDEKAEQAAQGQAREIAERRAREARRAAMSERLVRIEQFVEAMDARAKELRGGKEAPNGKAHNAARELARAAAGDDWTADEQRAAADAIEAWLPKVVDRIDLKDERKKLALRKLRGEG